MYCNAGAVQGAKIIIHPECGFTRNVISGTGVLMYVDCSTLVTNCSHPLFIHIWTVSAHRAAFGWIFSGGGLCPVFDTDVYKHSNSAVVLSSLIPLPYLRMVHYLNDI